MSNEQDKVIDKKDCPHCGWRGLGMIYEADTCPSCGGTMEAVA